MREKRGRGEVVEKGGMERARGRRETNGRR